MTRAETSPMRIAASLACALALGTAANAAAASERPAAAAFEIAQLTPAQQKEAEEKAKKKAAPTPPPPVKGAPPPPPKAAPPPPPKSLAPPPKPVTPPPVVRPPPVPPKPPAAIAPKPATPPPAVQRAAPPPPPPAKSPTILNKEPPVGTPKPFVPKTDPKLPPPAGRGANPPPAAPLEQKSAPSPTGVKPATGTPPPVTTPTKPPVTTPPPRTGAPPPATPQAIGPGGVPITTPPAPIVGPGGVPVTTPPAITPTRPAAGTPAAVPALKKLDEVKQGRTRETEDGGKRTVIREADNRVIIKQDNRTFIQSDENARLQRFGRGARRERRGDGTDVTIIERNGQRIYSESDTSGRLIRRYRVGPDGRERIIIDNRRKDNFGRNLAIGVGVGAAIGIGAIIANSVIDAPPPRHSLPREKYIVEYERASEEDVYEALSAPPVESLERAYTLDEVRYSRGLRQRMRRVDLDDINFEFGSWEVEEGQYRKLDRVGRAMMRVIERNPDEVFLIEGHTDKVGSDEDNLSLSDRRAEAVAQVLSEQFGVPPENLTTQGYGEQYPKVETDGPERLNRRVAVRRITPLISREDGPR